jgi:hypothetical protein
MAVLIGDDEIEQPSPAKRAVRVQAVDGREVVRLGAQAVRVEARDGRVLHGWSLEAVEGLIRAGPDAGRLEFEPGLVGHDLSRLCGTRNAVEALERLPPHPGELVVVPHDDERPSGASVLDVRVVQVGAIERTVVGERGRHVKTGGHRFAVGVAHQIAQPPIVATAIGRVFR